MKTRIKIENKAQEDQVLNYYKDRYKWVDKTELLSFSPVGDGLVFFPYHLNIRLDDFISWDEIGEGAYGISFKQWEQEVIAIENVPFLELKDLLDKIEKFCKIPNNGNEDFDHGYRSALEDILFNFFTSEESKKVTQLLSELSDSEKEELKKQLA